MRLFTCETCDGKGGWYEDYGLDWSYPMPWQDCPMCDGIGKVGFWEWFWCNAPVRLVEWVGDTFYSEKKG